MRAWLLALCLVTHALRAAEPCVARSVACGETVAVRFDPQCDSMRFAFDGRAGDVVTITARTVAPEVALTLTPPPGQFAGTPAVFGGDALTSRLSLTRSGRWTATVGTARPTTAELLFHVGCRPDNPLDDIPRQCLGRS